MPQVNVEADAEPRPERADLGTDVPCLDEVVAHLNRLYFTGSLVTARAIGEYLLQEFSGGDLDVFHSRGRKGASLRRLAARPDLKMSTTYLYQAVAVVEQLRQLPGPLGAALSLSHHKALLSVKAVKAKQELARAAVDEGLSSRALAVAVRNILPNERGDRPLVGRPADPPLVKLLNRLTSVRDSASAEQFDRQHLARMSPERMRELLEQARNAVEFFDEIVDRIEEVLEDGETS